jgi:hypothetical protein
MRDYPGGPPASASEKPQPASFGDGFPDFEFLFEAELGICR